MTFFVPKPKMLNLKIMFSDPTNSSLLNFENHEKVQNRPTLPVPEGVETLMQEPVDK